MKRIFEASRIGFIDLAEISLIEPMTSYSNFKVRFKNGECHSFPIAYADIPGNGKSLLKEYWELVDTWRAYVEQSAVAKTPPVG